MCYYNTAVEENYFTVKSIIMTCRNCTEINGDQKIADSDGRRSWRRYAVTESTVTSLKLTVELNFGFWPTLHLVTQVYIAVYTIRDPLLSGATKCKLCWCSPIKPTCHYLHMPYTQRHSVLQEDTVINVSKNEAEAHMLQLSSNNAVGSEKSMAISTSHVHAYTKKHLDNCAMPEQIRAQWVPLLWLWTWRPTMIKTWNL